MKKHYFSKYIVLTVSLCLAAFLILVMILSLYTRQFFLSVDEDRLETAAKNVNQTITAMMDLTQQDFNYLLVEEKELLSSCIFSLNTDGLEVFITDAMGKIVVSPRWEGQEISSSAMTEASAKARAGEVFQSDLEGFFGEERTCRVVLLEKEFQDQHKQRVGAVFISIESPYTQSYMSGLIRSFLAASFLVLSMLLVSFYLINREFARPLRLLNDAAEKFAHGDFSPRLPEVGGGELTPLFRAFNQMAQSVEENEKIRQTFVSNVSHDLRTPLTTIGGFIQNMENGAIPQEKYGHYFKIINQLLSHTFPPNCAA